MTYRPSPPGAAVSDLSAASSPLQGSDLVVVRRSGVDYKATVTQLQAYMQAQLSFGALPAPTIASAAAGTPGNTSVALTWTEGGGAVASRTVQLRTPSGSGSYSSATTSGLGSGTATVTGLSANTAYDFQITVTNATGSNTATVTNITTAATLASPTITSLAHGSVTSTTIPLTWTEGGGTVASRTVEVKTPTGGGSYASASTTGLGAGAATITGLTASTSYDVRVTVTNATSSANSVLTNTTTSAALAAPTISSLAHGTVTSTTIPLTWTEGGGTVASRTVEVKTPTGGGSYATASTTGLGSGAATITGLSGSTSYDVRVTLTNATSSNNAVLTNTTTTSSSSNPSTLMTAPYVWWDAVNSPYTDAGLTTPANVGDTVLGLKNLLSNGAKTLTQSDPTIAMKKVTGAAANGLPAITGLQDSNQYASLQAPSASWLSSLTGDMTILAVYKTTGDGNAGVFDTYAFRLDNAGGYYPGYNYSDVAIDDSTANGGWANPSGGAGPTFCTVFRVNASAKTMTLKVNSRIEASGTFTTNISTPGTFFIHGEQTTMQLYEIAISTAYETDSVRDSLISYAAARWGT